MIIHVFSGLTSRLYTIADAIEICKSNHINELVILWPIVSDCNISADDVFDPIEIENIKVDIVSFRTSRKKVKSIDFRKKPIYSIYAVINNFFAYIYNLFRDYESNIVKKYTKKMRCFDFDPPAHIGWSGHNYEVFKMKLWHEIEKYLQKDDNIYIHAYYGINQEVGIERDFTFLKFKQDYWNRTEAILGDYSKEKLIGIHIRRTDHARCITMSPTDLFVMKVEQILANEKDVIFFLSTDDVIIQNEFLLKYGERFVVQDKAWGRSTKVGMISGIVDLLCLSRCRCVIGSYSSNFSKFSAEYGSIPLIENKID